MLGLNCCAGLSLAVVGGGLLSSFSAWASHYGHFSCCGGARALGCIDFSSGDSWLWSTGSSLWCLGLVAPWCVESSQTRDRTCVSCTGRLILYHWGAREALIFLKLCLCSLHEFQLFSIFICELPYFLGVICVICLYRPYLLFTVGFHFFVLFSPSEWVHFSGLPCISGFFQIQLTEAMPRVGALPLS